MQIKIQKALIAGSSVTANVHQRSLKQFDAFAEPCAYAAKNFGW